MQGKQAADGSLAADLEKLAAACEKRGNDVIDNLPGQLTGAYGTYALGAGTLAAMAAYKWAKKRQEKSVLERAQRERARQLALSQPAPIYLTPSAAA
jgi:hypothetical protein